MFTGDEIMKRIDESARQFREADRRKACQRVTRRRMKHKPSAQFPSGALEEPSDSGAASCGSKSRWDIGRTMNIGPR